jgi:colicin import membrane protein
MISEERPEKFSEKFFERFCKKSDRRFILISLIFHVIFLVSLFLFVKENPTILNTSEALSQQPIIQASMVSAPPLKPIIQPTKPIEKPIEKPAPEVKPESKPQAVPPVKPEAKPEVKPEVKPEIKIPALTPVKPDLKPKPVKPSKPIKPAKPKPVIEKAVPVTNPVTHKMTPSQKTTPVKPAKDVNQKQAADKSAKAAAEKAKALAEIKQQMAEAAAAESQRVLTLEQKYMGLIQASIRSQWINQFDPLANLQVILVIELDPKGNVDSVQISQSSGNPAFDRQAVAAIQKASPLPIPDDASIAKDFAEITLPFSNQAE